MKRSQLKKLAVLFFCFVLVFSVTACSKGEEDQKTDAPAIQNTGGGTKDTSKPEDAEQPEDTGSSEEDTAADTAAVAPSDTKRVIRIGTWYDHYYSSKDTSIYDDPSMTDPETAQMRLDTIRRIEEKYNVEIQYVNLTWEGTIESINTSIMAGTPECDIYEVDLQFGVPAVLNGYAAALEDFVNPDNDIFHDQTVMKYLNIAGDANNYLFTPNATDLSASLLGFNMDMIQDLGLENPQDLYDRGEWTWAKFQEYLKALTRDTDGDGNVDVYGFSGWFTTMGDNLLMSNNAHVAGGSTEALSSPQTIEVLDFMYQIYQVDKTARPWNADSWDDNVSCYASGRVGFWTTATWVQSQYGTSSVTGFEIGMVPYPTGPSGNAQTNSQLKVSGNWYLMPVGIERPDLVYQVIYEMSNWYGGDISLRDDTEWAENQMETERNFSYLAAAAKTDYWFDIWQSISGVSSFYSVVASVDEQVLTATQASEQFKQIVQDYLDVYMN